MSTSRARALRHWSTDAERVLWRHLRNRQVDSVKFRRQFAIGPYFADFAAVERRLIIELDGGQHSGSPADEFRSRWLAGQGYRVIRFWNNDVLANLDGVL
jgi:ATP-dependent helicase HrpA/adenine-specific DNA-methyltransferase